MSRPPASRGGSGPAGRARLAGAGALTFRRAGFRQFLLYGLVGSSAALVQMGLLFLYVELLGLRPLAASTLALAFSIAFNYCLQRRITFQSSAKHHIAGPRFFGIAVTTLGANAAIFSMLLGHVPYLAAQAITIALIFPINFQLNKRLTFRS